MDRKVIFAVAGAGKTSEIINDLNRTQRALIVTYTKENRNNILQRINAKFHCLPDNIVCLTYFSFIYEWGVKPFELRALQKVIDGIDFEGTAPRGLKKSDLNYYTIGTRILHYRLYNFIKWQGLTEKLINRLKYFFDCIYIDEVQDFAGGDFDFIMDLARSSFPWLKIVGARIKIFIRIFLSTGEDFLALNRKIIIKVIDALRKYVTLSGITLELQCFL